MKITIITVCYNSENFISSAIGSVLSQTYSNIQYIVIDGGSKDSTVSIVDSYGERISHFVSEPDKGIYDALNKGIARASGDVIGFLHADDLYAHSGVLATIARAFEDPSVCAVYGDLQYVRKEDTTQLVRHWASRPFVPPMLRQGWMPPHPTLYVRRKWYERIGGFDTNYRIAADYFSVLQLFSQPGFKAVYIPEVLVKMRVGGASNRSFKNIIRKSREDYDALRRSNFGVLPAAMALGMKNFSKIGQFLGKP